jgi:NAD(P)-dependent dehydrogenase (short-subunit alcohol dehydrogenase family)
MRIDNKQIIVVGASRGLGRGIAVALAGADARVLAIGRGQGALDELRRQSQGRVEIFVGDGTNPSFVARVLSAEDPDGVFIV